MLRPIDVIFKNPIKKFTVIYQNGKLWQLNRLDFDGKSLAYKRPYTGSREQIFVAQDQSLPANDLLLRSQLATIPLPATVVGRNADEFEHWWRQNSFECRELSAQAKQLQAQAKAQLANPVLQVEQSTLQSVAVQVENNLINVGLDASIPTSPTVITNSPTFVAQPQSALPTLSITNNSANLEDDIFEQMMGDLTQNLR